MNCKSHQRYVLSLLLASAIPMVASLLAAQTLLQPSSRITAIDARTGVATASVNATGEEFQFRLNNSALLNTLKIGQGVYANLQAKQVSLDGQHVAGTIVSIDVPKGPLTPGAIGKAPASSLRGASQPGSASTPSPASPTSSTNPACCSIASIDAAARLVAAKENSTGHAFEFSVPNSVAIENLRVAQGIWANFKARKVSIDGKTACCDIVSFDNSSPREVRAAGGPLSNASPQGSSATAGHAKTQSPLLAVGESATGLKQQGIATTTNGTPPQIQNFGVLPGPIPGGQEDVGRVDLAGVPADGATVQLSADQPSVASVPNQVQVSGSGPSAGWAVIVVKTSPVSKSTDVTLSANLAGSSDVHMAKLTVRPAQLSMISCSPLQTPSGVPFTCKVWLDGKVPGQLAQIQKLVPSSPANAVQVQITANQPPIASPPATVAISPGSDMGEFNVPTTPDPQGGPVTITASYNGVSKSASVTLGPSWVKDFGCSVKGATNISKDCSLTGGWSSIVNDDPVVVWVSLLAPAGSGGLTIPVDGGPSISVPAGKAFGSAKLGNYTLIHNGNQVTANDGWQPPFGSVPAVTNHPVVATDPSTGRKLNATFSILPPRVAGILLKGIADTAWNPGSIQVRNVPVSGLTIQVLVEFDTDAACMPGHDHSWLDVRYSGSPDGRYGNADVSGTTNIGVNGSKVDCERNYLGTCVVGQGNTDHYINGDYYAQFNVAVKPCSATEHPQGCQAQITVSSNQMLGSQTGTIFVSPE